VNTTSEKKNIFTVSELTKSINNTLDKYFAFFWITGEISNFASPSSGHLYFSLKDSTALINAVIFKNQKKHLKFKPENGLQVVGFGRISIYPPRGSYQIIFEYIEPKGLGSLQLMFEQTKNRLKKEGLFDEKYKQRLPFLPQKITIVTSPTGAALQDMLKIFRQRYENLEIEIFPVVVQGQKAEKEIAEAIKNINFTKNTDLIIIARGGGSFEDLMPFNSEKVARAVFNSDIPVISGIGHETDYTITDFVSDLRAPTPTAAAEYAIPNKKDLISTLSTYEKRLEFIIKNLFDSKKDILNQKLKKLKNPYDKISEQRISLDLKTEKLIKEIEKFICIKKENNNNAKKILSHKKIEDLKISNRRHYEATVKRLCLAYSNFLKTKRLNYEKIFSKFYELGPYTTLKRGYSIIRELESKKVLRSINDFPSKGEKIEIILNDGMVNCLVEKIRKERI